MDARVGAAERLPWPTGHFDAVLSCLVIGFLRDPARAILEMARITRPGGTVAACMWDTAGGGMTMLQTFWGAVRQVQPAAPGETGMAGTAEGDIASRLRDAGLQEVISGALVSHADFDDFWQPFTLGVGPSGHYLNTLSASQQTAVRDACRRHLPDGSFTKRRPGPLRNGDRGGRVLPGHPDHARLAVSRR